MEMKKNTDKVEVEKCPPKKTVVGYVFSRELVALANQLPEVRGRVREGSFFALYFKDFKALNVCLPPPV